MALPGRQIEPSKPKRKRKNRAKKKTKLFKQLDNLHSQEAEATASLLSSVIEHQLRDDHINQGDNEQPYQQTTHNNISDDDDMYISFRDRTEREQENWRKVLPLMFPTFMRCSKKTFQWGDEVLWNRDWKKGCNCTASKKRQRKVDVVDLLSRKKITINFCACQPDSVRLVQMGLIGGTPQNPVTAFSIRLLRFHHMLWKLCRVRIQPFCSALDEFLDGSNPIIVSASGDRVREWRKNFSPAVDAFREMLRLEGELKIKALKLTQRQQLAANCPRCFGPRVKGKRDAEPDFIVCLDGNFQHRRHKFASAEWREDPKLPSLFLPQDAIDKWDNKMNPSNPTQKKKRKGTTGQNDDDDELLDPCSVSHTAADDARGKQTWSGCDETGLFGMACRHDHVLKFINIVQSGERGHFPVAMLDWLKTEISKFQEDQGESLVDWNYRVLYDIGCNLEKAVQKEREEGRMKFGTGAWHSYAHQRSCQIKYNPRLNPDWGMSDGEGLERIWSFLCDLIAPLRHSTKEHRLWALHFQAFFHNELSKNSSVDSMSRRMKEMNTLISESRKKLDILFLDPNYNMEKIVEQWDRQRTCQLKVICTENMKALNEKLAHLVDLEENEELKATRRKRRRGRTEADEARLLRLPDTLIVLEEEINYVIDELGADEFRNIPGASSELMK
ncbi:hypothetical protein DFH28DRAFT_906642 [Melampsora americana]|nr:hypothetical protein DFH28DRAFT_906642 [Melampsora americana]